MQYYKTTTVNCTSLHQINVKKTLRFEESRRNASKLLAAYYQQLSVGVKMTDDTKTEAYKAAEIWSCDPGV